MSCDSLVPLTTRKELIRIRNRAARRAKSEPRGVGGGVTGSDSSTLLERAGEALVSTAHEYESENRNN